MSNKIRVFGKAQNRTVLGIVKAYLIMNPKATLADLERVFPPSLNTGLSAYKLTSSFVTPKILKSRDTSKMKLCFDDDPIKLSNGTTIYLFSLWQKVDFEKVIELAKGFSIEVADYKPTKGFQKGGYQIEYLNGYTPSAGGSKWWLWLLLLAILAGVLFLLASQEEEPAPAPVVVEEVAPVIVAQIKEIQTKFNDVKFDLNKSDLREESKVVLGEVVTLMTENPEVKLNIIGHSSNEGDATANQLLSESRAKSVAKYIVESGIAADRITSEGKGSSQPLDPNNRSANRRTEFVIIK